MEDKLNAKGRIIHLLKKETVLVIATILAIISAFFNPPSKEYIDFIDWRVLGILLSLMLVMAGFQINGVFRKLGEMLLRKCSNTWMLSFVLIFMCFFSGMILTNDVALITFVPFSLLTLKMTRMEHMMVQVVVGQTIAANLGSMLTPMGNPQNLYLYGVSGMNIGEFIMLMLPYTIASAVLLSILILLTKRRPLSLEGMEEKHLKANPWHIAMYIVLFMVCILCVLHVIEWYIVTVITVIIALVMDRRVFAKTDYSLLLTFISFFIFIGNIGQIDAVRDMLSKLIEGRELLVSIVSSQVVSNVPAALLLSGFTSNYNVLIIGVNLGGLGTLIASMASLISYKQFVNAYPEKKGRYFRYFTIINVIFLIALAGLYMVLN